MYHLLIPVFIDQLGTGGVGYVWSICEGSHEEEWRHSIAPIPADKLAEAMESTEEDLDLITQNGSVLPPSGELKPDSNDSDDDNEDSRDDSVDFEKEVIVSTGNNDGRGSSFVIGKFIHLFSFAG